MDLAREPRQRCTVQWTRKMDVGEQNVDR